MTIRKAKAIENAGAWHIRCPECKARIDLDECPVPGGMVANIETCFECGTHIEVQPRKED
jgi:rRNA maturation endonuclease Nob1